MAQPEVPSRTGEDVSLVPSGNPAADGSEAEVASNYCPRCSTRLASRSCKLICPECGYYMSCSDFY